jgi:transcription elongation factor Elf1
MGQTDDWSFSDEHGMLWTWIYICPYCGQTLATRHLVDYSMNLSPDDIIGCDDCGLDISVEAAPLILENLDGERA